MQTVSSDTQLCLTFCDLMDYSTPGFPVHHQFLKLAQTHVYRISDAIKPSHPLLSLLLLSSIFPSIRFFPMSQFFESNINANLSKYWSFSFSIRLSNEYSGRISFRMDWLDLLAVQGTLKSLCQHHSSKTSILRCPAFFIVQLSHPYMTTGETIALARWAFADKVMSLRFNMLSRLVIAFLPRSKRLLLSWLQSPSAVILEPKEIKSLTVFHFSPHLHTMKWWHARGHLIYKLF